MGKLFQVVHPSTGQLVHAVKVEGGIRTGATSTSPACFIPDATASTSPARVDALAPFALVIPDGDTLARLVADLAAHALVPTARVGKHGDVLRFYSRRVAALAEVKPAKKAPKKATRKAPARKAPKSKGRR